MGGGLESCRLLIGKIGGKGNDDGGCDLRRWWLLLAPTIMVIRKGGLKLQIQVVDVR